MEEKLDIKKILVECLYVLILLYGCTKWTLTKRMEKKAWRQLHKNSASNIEQILEATPYKAPTTHHENYQY